jgi:peptide/nickel transport system substrate-binding protein
MYRNKLFLVVSLVVLASMLLAACGQATVEVIKTVVVTSEPAKETVVVNQTQVVEKTVQVETTKEVVKVVTPTAVVSNRTGGWADSIVFTVQNSAEAAVKQLDAGEIDAYAYTVANPSLFKTVQGDQALTFSNAFGSMDEITYNVAVFKDENRLNPFSNAKIREATNWLYDRNYIVQEIFQGLGNLKFTTLSTAFADYARYADLAATIENKYAFNEEKAKQIIGDEMKGMGATAGSDGKWTFKDKPVVLDFLIRTEDERKQIGDYAAGQLEKAGFTVNRLYKTRSEASPLWVQSDPTDAKWTLYTGGWINTAISRDDGSNFSFYYTKNDYPIPLFQAYTNPQEFEDVALALRNNSFKTMDERKSLFDKALTMSLEQSERVWLVDIKSYAPVRKNVAVAYDLAAGIAGSSMWPYTMRLQGQEGGVIRVAQPGLMVDPWNPVAGSNWIYDAMPIRATENFGVLFDPYTGLQLPSRIEKAEVVAKEGLPVAKTLDWLTLSTAPTIEVPKEAWVDWDAKNQKFITAGEKYTSTATANLKITVTYPKDLFTKIKWHDGSPLSVGDFVMGMIMTFDPGKKDSKEYDESIASTLDAFLAHFKGVQITSTDPLTIVTYDDQSYLDAESAVYNGNTWWPEWINYGPASWHVLSVGMTAVTNKKLAWSTDQASKAKIEWMNLISGPSLDELKKDLEAAAKDNVIPFAPTMSQYVKADEATARYKNLQAWVAARNHFWVGTGPYYLYKVFPVEQTLTLQRNTDFPDPATKWAQFSSPMLITAEVDGPAQVEAGKEAVFNVTVTTGGQPYPADQISAAKYLVFDANGALVAQGDAKAAGDGKYTVTLSADDTKAFKSGAYKLQVALASKSVSVPGFATFQFVVP